MTTKQNVASTWRGICKVTRHAVGVVEAASWLVLLWWAYTAIWSTLKNQTVTLNDFALMALGIAAAVISFRLAYEGAKYFREIGEEWER